MLQSFDADRLKQIEELLRTLYNKRYEYEQELLVTASPPQKFEIRHRMRNELLPKILQYEEEYAQIVVREVPTEAIPKSEAESIVAAASSAATAIGKKASAEGQDLLLGAISNLLEKLADPSADAAAKLKVSLPIIPTIVSYEVEVDTTGLMRQVWQRAKSLMKRLLPPPR